MNDGSLHVALREVRHSFRNPVTWATLAGLSLVLGISGPFDTFAALSLPARLAYWATVVPLTYAAGLIGSTLARHRMARHRLARHRMAQHRLAQHLTPAVPLARTLAAGLASAALVSLTLALLNGALGFLTPDPVTVLEGLAAITLICLSIEGLGDFIASRTPSAPATAPVATPARATTPPTTIPPTTTPQPTAVPDPALLRRLPPDKRGTLISLTVQDHYVEVHTTRGRTLLLMRLGDAIAECTPVAGLQTHRSHWVALSQVARARREGDAAVLTLHNGAKVPVSRSRIRSAIAAGLFHSPGTD